MFKNSDIADLPTPSGQREYYDSLDPAECSAPGSFGIRVNQSGKKSFFVLYQIGGRRRRITVGHFPTITVEEARRRAIKALELAASGRDPKVPGAVTHFSELCELFLEKHGRPNLRETTLKEYRRLIDQEITARLGNARVESITKADVFALLDDIATDRGKPVLCERVRLLLSRIFEFGRSRHLLDENPVSTLPTFHSSVPRERTLTQEELQQLWGKLNDLKPGARIALQLILLTAQKPSHVLGMRWQDIHFDTWMITTTHRIPLTDLVSELLAEIRQSQTDRHTIYVFGSRNGRHISSIRSDVRQLNAALKPNPSWSAYDLRKTAQLLLERSGARPDVIERILGRKSYFRRVSQQSPTFDYASEMREALTKLAESVLAIVQGKAQTQRGRTGVVLPISPKVIPLFPTDRNK